MHGRMMLVSLMMIAGAASAASAQPDTAARRLAMQKLSFLTGEWSGNATAMIGRGQPLEMRQTERVRYVVGGQVLLVEGIGQLLRNGQPADTAFHAIATIDWLPNRGYLMRSIVLAGHQGEYPLELTDTGFKWSLAVPGGMVNYTMQRTSAGEWDERGVFTPAGATTGFPVVTMMLKPVKLVP